MLLKNVLNQFERDWAESALRENCLDLSSIFHKNIVISGNSMITRAIALALLSINDKKHSRNKIIILCKSNKVFSSISDREDVSFNYYDSEKLCFEIDYWIESSFLILNDNFSLDDAKSVLSNAAAVTKIISAHTPKKLLLISDNSVYGRLESGFAASESESGEVGLDCTNLRSVTLQSVENIFSSSARQFGFILNIMRSSVIVCPFSDSGFMRKMISYVSGGSDSSEGFAFDCNFKNKISFIGINDFITAVFYILINGTGTVYNACSDNSTCSLPALAVIIEELFNVKVDFIQGGARPVGCAVSSAKLQKAGWKSSYDLKDALLISKYAYLNSDKVFMFPDAYDGKLYTVQKILLGFLLEIDRICKKYNIKYFLAGGTLLGAIRHHGFIPWDDDADVMMLREDYDKFLSVLPKELPQNLFMQTQEKTSHFPFLKIRIDNTVFSTEFTSHFDNIHNGIFFDVLAQDYTSNNKLIRKLHMKFTASARWLVLNKWRNTPVDANSKISSFIANILKSILPLSLLDKVQDKLISLYKNKKDAKYLFDSMGRNISRGEFPAKWFDEAILVDFEGVKLPVPKAYDEYLTYLYGDYMDMIPVSKRHVSHEIIEMDLGEYTNYFLRNK